MRRVDLVVIVPVGHKDDVKIVNVKEFLGVPLCIIAGVFAIGSDAFTFNGGFVQSI